MKHIHSCPECGKIFSDKLKKCTCGWFYPDADEKKVADHCCQYRINNRRCPLPGTIRSPLYGHGSWYCSDHWGCLDDSQMGEAILLNAEKNYEQILKDRQDWRRKLFTR